MSAPGFYAERSLAPGRSVGRAALARAVAAVPRLAGQEHLRLRGSAMREESQSRLSRAPALWRLGIGGKSGGDGWEGLLGFAACESLCNGNDSCVDQFC